MNAQEQNLPEYLRNEYELWKVKLNDFDKSTFNDYVSTEEVLYGYYVLVDYFHSQKEILNYGIKDFNLIGSAVGRQFTEWHGKKKWTEKLDIAATLFYGLNKNHAFSDGNKRTSLLMLLYFLIKNHYIFEGQVQKEFERLALKTAENTLSDYPCFNSYKNKDDPEIRTISHIIKRYIRKADTAYVSMTFQEFFNKLNKKGFEYEINGGYATIYKFEKKLFKTNKVNVKQIGCPGLKKQINLKAAKEALKACGFTYENGHDFQSFLNGNDSMYKLVNDFEGPLRRLKDK